MCKSHALEIELRRSVAEAMPKPGVVLVNPELITRVGVFYVVVLVLGTLNLELSVSQSACTQRDCRCRRSLGAGVDVRL